jgi:hypothetical protein
MKLINKEDLKLSKYKDRFKKSRTNKFKKIGILEVSFFNMDIDTNLNYIHNEKLCYLKFINCSLKSNMTKYEVREIVEMQ